MHESLVQLMDGAQLAFGDAIGAAEVKRHNFLLRFVRVAAGGVAEQCVDFLLGQGAIQ